MTYGDYVIDIDAADNDFVSGTVEITDRVADDVAWFYGMGDPWAFMPQPSRMEIKLDNGDGALDFPSGSIATTFNSFSPKVRIRGTVNAVTTTLFVGYVTSIKPTFGLREWTTGKRQATLTLEDRLLRMTGIGFNPTILTDATTDEAISAILTAFVPNDTQNLDTGLGLFEIWGDDIKPEQFLDAANMVSTTVNAEGGGDTGLFYWDPKASEWVFKNRRWIRKSYDDNSSAAHYTIASTKTIDSNFEWLGDIVNRVALTYAERASNDGALLYSVESPLRLRPFEDVTIVVKYRDVLAQGASRFAGANQVDPVIGVTLRIDDDETGSGDTGIEAGYTISSITHFSDRTELTLTNTILDRPDYYIVRLDIRGTQVSIFDTDLIISEDSDSIDDHGRYGKQFSVRRVGYLPDLQDWADITLLRRKNPGPFLRSITVQANEDLATTQMAHGIEVGHIVRITDTTTGHDEYYGVVGLGYKLSNTSNLLDVKMILRPFLGRTEIFFVLDSSLLDGPHILQY